jgi:hypothetical protein
MRCYSGATDVENTAGSSVALASLAGGKIGRLRLSNNAATFACTAGKLFFFFFLNHIYSGVRAIDPDQS